MFVGMDLRKKFVQVAVLDDKGKVLQNGKVENNCESIKEHFADMPCLQISSESSSVWYGTYRFMTDELGYKNVILSNPYLTKALPHQRKRLTR